MIRPEPATPGDFDAAERRDHDAFYGDHYDGDDDRPTLAECDRDEAEMGRR